MMNNLRRKFLKSAYLVSLAVAARSSGLRASPRFPNRPVQLIVPFEPGGGSDISFRSLAPYLQRELGVPVNVVNIAGGSGWVAWHQMARWDALSDDHKLGVVNIPHILSYFDPRQGRTETVDSFNFLAWQSLDPCVWAIRSDETRFNSLKTFLDYVRLHPGDIVISSTGVGSDDHMGIAFAEKYIPGFKVKKLYANGDGKKIRELISGVSDCVAGNVAAYMPYVRTGQMKFICTLNPQRYPLIADVPTFLEVTGKRNISFAGRTIVCAPGLAEDKKAIYLAATERALNDRQYLEQEAKNNNTVTFMKGAAIRRLIDETTEYVKAVRYWDVEM